MKTIKNSVALVTGANRGLGREFVSELLERGAAKVYAATRTPHDFGDPRVVNVPLDLSDPTSIKKLPELAPDAELLISNAGVFINMGVLSANIDTVRTEFETNVFGPIQLVQAMAPVIKDGVLVNVVSVGSWLPFGAYGASKAALWSLSNTLRGELAAQHTQVTSLHVGPMDTDMVRALDLPKENPRDVARATLEAVVRGESEVLFDDLTRNVKAMLSGSVEKLAYS